MVQHVKVVLAPDPNDNQQLKPFAESTTNLIWRDDQELCWFLSQEVITAGWGWDNSREAGPNRAIEFHATVAAPEEWLGSAPVPVGTLPNLVADTRHYFAVGPGANTNNNTGSPVPMYAYRLYFVNGETKFSHDPEVGNQPQP
jgi:hypothetical protein